MDRYLLVGSTLCFLLGFAYTMYCLGARLCRSSPFNLAVLTAGFLLQTAFLYFRGKELGRCPLTNLFEVIVFLSWAMVFFYLIIGNSYRLSPLGMFTAPLAFALQTFALIAPLDRPASHAGSVNPWLEFHAAFSVLAYGAFALASVAAGMYLLQERQLKTHRLNSIFFQLPPMAELGQVNSRLVTMGFLLLSLGLAAGIGMGTPNAWLHLSGPLVTWVFYAFLVQARWGGVWKIVPRQLARLSIVAFSVALLTLWGLNFADPRPASISPRETPNPAPISGLDQ
jgi:ABC-type transport system involved in cytochrome c biogenesis permease subunit